MTLKRIQENKILQDLEKKIVIITGPRQAGKTWLSLNLAKNYKKSLYLNYDQFSDKDIIHNQSWEDNIELLILDELHKMPNWKNYLKGLYDTKNKNLKILVTGSARMSIFNQMGDSLAGRYFKHRLLPLSLSELKQVNYQADINQLIEKSGFPEPFLTQEQIDVERWRMQYTNSILSTDVFEFEKIHNLKAIQMTFELLRNKVGSPISYKSIAEDINTSSVTVKKYIEILESLFVIFKVSPFSKNIARSILKEPKIYFFDTGLVKGDPGIKFENFVATSLLKHIYGKIDYEAKDYKLNYLRTKESKEVDFAITNSDKIEQIIEAKLSKTETSKNLLYFKNRYNLNAIQIVKNLKRNFKDKNNIDIKNASSYLKELYI